MESAGKARLFLCVWVSAGVAIIIVDNRHEAT